MKRKLFSLAIIAMAITAPGCGMEKTTYPDTGLVTCVDTETDTVTYVCQNGNEFQFYGTEDWMEGDLVSVIMENMGTDTVYDDEIVTVRYSGWFDGDITDWVRVD